MINKLSDTLKAIVELNQYAYLKKVSTTDVLIQMIDDWTAELDNPKNMFIQCGCLGFSKAFDRLDQGWPSLFCLGPHGGIGQLMGPVQNVTNR